MPKTPRTPYDATIYARETFSIVDAKAQTLLVNHEPDYTELITFGPKGSVKSKVKLNQQGTDKLIATLALNNPGWATRLGTGYTRTDPQVSP